MAEYNAIVVGAGAAGAPLAAGLSEDPGRTVLLVEAGPDYVRTEDFPADLLNSGLVTGFMPGHPNNWGCLSQQRTRSRHAAVDALAFVRCVRNPLSLAWPVLHIVG